MTKTNTAKKTPAPKTMTLAQVADKVGITAKAARGKFRRFAGDGAPFDHTKVTELNAKQAQAAREFLETDYRTNADA